MRLLHTSDLHLGLSLHEESMYEDQLHILNEIINVIKNNNIDGIMISGDIYDQRQATPEAISLFDDFLGELSKLNIDIYIIPGNHDRVQLVSYGSSIFENNNIYIGGKYNGRIDVIHKEDIDIYLMPFIRPSHIKHLLSEDEYKNIKNTNDLFKWILNREQLNKNKKNIILLHQYVGIDGKQNKFSESESSSYKGKTDLIDYKQFKDFDYVALGHLHAPQEVGDKKIRYSGTPCKYSFSEVDNINGVVIYDSDKDDIEIIELKPLRQVRVISGTIKEILAMPYSEDLIKLDFKDEDIAQIPWPEIYDIFPKTLTYKVPDKKRNSSSIFIDSKSIKESLSLQDVFEKLFEFQNARKLSDKEKEIVKEVLDKMGDN